jgi:NADH-quinone oxidoreductase subunit N
MTLAAIQAPHIDWASLSPLIALAGGAVLVLVVGLIASRGVRNAVLRFLTVATFAATIGLGIWRWGDNATVLVDALRIDELTLFLTFLFCMAGIVAVLLAHRGPELVQAGHGEFYALLISSVAGMVVLVGAENLIVLFIGFELLSIPLYILCAAEIKRASSLESGLKYLVIGSLGSATLLYGLAFIYGATGSTYFDVIAQQLAEGGLLGDPLLLVGIGLSVVGLAFKASVAPFHQWTPDVYEGAPTSVTAFMSVATKAAALGVFLRLFDQALISAQLDWDMVIAVLATITIIVGNVGALAQSSLKRMLAYSSVAQAGYLLAGVVVGSQLGIKATAFYLAVYLLMTLGSFAVIVARERETDLGDHIDAMAGLGATRPLLAWPMTLAMFGLAGIPATAGFIGKFYLIDAAIDGSFDWLGVVIVIGSMISLGYYLRVVAVMWMRPALDQPKRRVSPSPAIAGGSPEADREDGLAGDGDRPGAGDAEQPAAGESEPIDEKPEAGGSESATEPAAVPAATPSAASATTGASGTGAGDEDRDGGFSSVRDAIKADPPATLVAVLCGAATLCFGIIPQPLLDLADQVSKGFPGLF